MPGNLAKRKKILHIEDDPGYQELFVTILSKDFEVKTCSSVEEALPHLETGAFSMVMTDINLFGMTGFEVLEKIRQSAHLKHLPVVVCSSQSDEDTRKKALAMGAVEFVAKPYDFETVQNLAKRLLA
jgi:DNA-binding NtrC family response regulator